MLQTVWHRLTDSTGTLPAGRYSRNHYGLTTHDRPTDRPQLIESFINNFILYQASKYQLPTTCTHITHPTSHILVCSNLSFQIDTLDICIQYNNKLTFNLYQNRVWGISPRTWTECLFLLPSSSSPCLVCYLSWNPSASVQNQTCVSVSTSSSREQNIIIDHRHRHRLYYYVCNHGASSRRRRYHYHRQFLHMQVLVQAPVHLHLHLQLHLKN